MSQGHDAEIRISAQERDQSVEMLAEHMASGRLEPDEYEFRCVRAVAARTRGEIEVLFADLPGPHPDLSGAVRPHRRGPLGAVRPGKHGKDESALVPTPASEAVGMLCGLLLVLGLPGTILLTVYFGWWWSIVAVVGVTIVAGAAEEALKRRP